MQPSTTYPQHAAGSPGAAEVPELDRPLSGPVARELLPACLSDYSPMPLLSGVTT